MWVVGFQTETRFCLGPNVGFGAVSNSDSESDFESGEDEEAELRYDEDGSLACGEALLLPFRRQASRFFRLCLDSFRRPSPWPSELLPEPGFPPDKFRLKKAQSRWTGPAEVGVVDAIRGGESLGADRHRGD